MQSFRLLVFLACFTICQSEPEPPRVRVRRLGTVLGTHETLWFNNQTVEVFRGIPFAEPPIGMRRFRETQLVEKFPYSPFNASEYPPACIQIYANFTQDEDCLYLNIWRPAVRRTKLPVIVMIYGGAFIVGHSRSPNYSGLPLTALHDVIVVNFNYRLGAFGFSDLSEIVNLPGNQGFLDQRLAIKWVKEFIEDFGGDPTRITLMGCSAGAVGVSYHLKSPLSQGLVRGAVMDAGVLSTKRLETVRSSLRRMIRLAVKVGCNSTRPHQLLRCLRKVPAAVINDASMTVMDSPLLSFRPTKFPEELLEAVSGNVSVFLGHSGSEGLTLVSNGFGINDPLPEFRSTHEAVEWCKVLLMSGLREFEENIESQWSQFKDFLDRLYFKGYEHSLVDRAALFLGDMYFHCSMLSSYKTTPVSTFYVFERAFKKNVFWDNDPEIYKSFHMTAHMHFVGSQLLTLRDEIHPEDLAFTLKSMEWIADFASHSSVAGIPRTSYPAVVSIDSEIRRSKQHEALDRCRHLKEFFKGRGLDIFE
ncbi:cholinesterase 2 [Galendromus occidentalis]|uniref:Carboxylic ester hydrolase n=1 Tax=Galendromus occidentalis TaxID=34638 RepID=A0AAJ6QU31_9ACAR|nr:cholinesterase 2 [Galendromus occidentalis]